MRRFVPACCKSAPTRTFVSMTIRNTIQPYDSMDAVIHLSIMGGVHS